MTQTPLFPLDEWHVAPAPPLVVRDAALGFLPDFASYDRIVVAFSGGADSLGCLLHLLDLGVPLAKVELWHHLIDGAEGSTLMDWPCTPAYCRAVAQALGVPLYFSWRVGGFEREMLKVNDRVAPVRFEMPWGKVGQAGGTHGKIGTRLKFPQVSNDLTVRWCSSRLKIQVGEAALINQPRFRGARTLFITGERAEESTARAEYAIFEPHSADLRRGQRYQRHIDHWRPVHHLPKVAVWEMVRRYLINPHPAYRLGFSRTSCMKCIFLGDRGWATLHLIDPAGIQTIADHERDFGVTIHRTRSVMERIARAVPYPVKEEDVRAALSTTWYEPIFLPLGEWVLPAGALAADSCGPT